MCLSSHCRRLLLSLLALPCFRLLHLSSTPCLVVWFFLLTRPLVKGPLVCAPSHLRALASARPLICSSTPPLVPPSSNRIAPWKRRLAKYEAPAIAPLGGDQFFTHSFLSPHGNVLCLLVNRAPLLSSPPHVCSYLCLLM